ncbi:15-hydroxyprostaglandin dehydrogenase [NAD(+)]-like isoform X2 [Mya arenaria]|uniref:15-hydroxyprostaglandin dehydrogenase [NAD(+)]-like isoform X2 n=1 Tax=Mya arenaria TaxID=6604 RepID=UPI0022DE97E2|nr:15-hydroxyprostaglandin dehydrogenase [NAD(+)]-like isoform X2 [Mya arenaria]
MKIPGAVVIVTGGSRGLGRAFSVELLKRGARVCVADINETEGRQTEAELQRQYGADKAFFVKCDVTKEDDTKDLWRVAVERFTTVDLMVNNAGIMNETLVEETVQINLMGAMRGSMLAFEHMRRDRGGKGGVIINVASTAGLFPVFFMPTYVASKYALVGFTRSWAPPQYRVVFVVEPVPGEVWCELGGPVPRLRRHEHAVCGPGRPRPSPRYLPRKQGAGYRNSQDNRHQQRG